MQLLNHSIKHKQDHQHDNQPLVDSWRKGHTEQGAADNANLSKIIGKV
jgi:hypothetical protein